MFEYIRAVSKHRAADIVKPPKSTIAHHPIGSNWTQLGLSDIRVEFLTSGNASEPKPRPKPPSEATVRNTGMHTGMHSGRLARRLSAAAGGAAIIAMISLTAACGQSEEPEETTTTTPTETTAETTAESPTVNPTEKAPRIDPHGPNPFSPTVKAPPAPNPIPGQD